MAKISSNPITDGLLSHFAEMADKAKKDRKIIVNIKEQLKTASLADIGMSLQAARSIKVDLYWQKALSSHEYTSCRTVLFLL